MFKKGNLGVNSYFKKGDMDSSTRPFMKHVHHHYTQPHEHQKEEEKEEKTFFEKMKTKR